MKINMVLWKTLLSALNPERKDITVNRKRGEEKKWKVDKTMDMMLKEYSFENYEVRNKNNELIFSFQKRFIGTTPVLDIPGRFSPQFAYTLKINDVTISYNVENQENEVSLINFAPTLKTALDQKIQIQEYNAEYAQTIKNMSEKEKATLKYLANTLQR